MFVATMFEVEEVGGGEVETEDPEGLIDNVGSANQAVPPSLRPTVQLKT
jgi:hypothetical protein